MEKLCDVISRFFPYNFVSAFPHAYLNDFHVWHLYFTSFHYHSSYLLLFFLFSVFIFLILLTFPHTTSFPCFLSRLDSISPFSFFSFLIFYFLSFISFHCICTFFIFSSLTLLFEWILRLFHVSFFVLSFSRLPRHFTTFLLIFFRLHALFNVISTFSLVIFHIWWVTFSALREYRVYMVPNQERGVIRIPPSFFFFAHYFLFFVLRFGPILFYVPFLTD